MDHANYNFAFLDERTKKMIRRATLKAVAIPGYQVPFGSREMPFAYGWGTGGIQVTATNFGSTPVSETVAIKTAPPGGVVTDLLEEKALGTLGANGRLHLAIGPHEGQVLLIK